MANEITNLYAELEESLSPNVTNVKDVLAAIDQRVIWYNKKINNPKYRTQVPIMTKALKELKKQIEDNPAIIQQHAVAYADIAREKQMAREKTIREKGNLFVRDGMIAQANLTQLANETGMSEQDILKLLGARVKQKRTFNYKDDGVKELDAMKMKTINEHLKILGKKTLYDFLALPPNSAIKTIMDKVNFIFGEISSNINKTDPKVNATDLLVKQCITIFKDETGRRSYEKAMENEGFASVRDTINMMKAGAKYINPAQYKQMLDICTKNGIAKDKAEYLIYTTAEKAGIDIDEGSAGDLTACRYCGALNEKHATACRSCGMPVRVVCPKCGKESASDDYRCTKCGFSLIDMKEAKTQIKMARVSLSANDIKGAQKAYDTAAGFWPGCKELDALMKEISEKYKQVGTMQAQVKTLCSQKKYYAARKDIDKLPVGDPLRQEIEDAIDTAEQLLKKAAATSDANQKLDCYMQALQVCPDCKAAQDKIRMTPPQSPTGLAASVLGRNIRLTWQKSSSNYISYMIVRKENAQPSGASDGEVLGETRNASFDDDKASPGISYFYAVYGKCGDTLSAKPSLLTVPVMRVEEIDPKCIKVTPQESSLEFSFNAQRGLYAIEIYRETQLVKTLIGGTSYIDNGLVSRKTYNYRFVAVYKDSVGNSHKSGGIVLQFTPMPKPKAVDLQLQDGERQAVLKWQTPAVGSLCIYCSETPFRYNRNDIISIDTFRAERLNVTGNSCTINKNFSGERYYLPVTVQGNMGVAGNAVNIVAVSPLSGVTITQDEYVITVGWKWDGVSAIRITQSIDDGYSSKTDLLSSATKVTNHRITVPKTAKSVSVSVMSLVRTASGKELLGIPVTKVFSMKAVRVAFADVSNRKKFGFIATDDYTIKVSTDAFLPCDLHLLVQEQFPPIDLVHYTPMAVIRPSELKPGTEQEVPFTFKRRMKGQSLHFRLIAANRAMAKQVIVTPETRQI